MGILADLNAWIINHQALVVAVGLPVLTALASGIVAFITNAANLKSNEKDRAQQRQVRIFDDRKARIDQMRSAVRRYETANFMLGADLHAGLSSGVAGQIPKLRVKETLEQVISIMIEIILLVDPKDSDAQNLNDALNLQLLNFSIDDRDADPEQIKKKFFPICQRIIERMDAEANRLIVV